ncbi:Ig-like domain repeat protein [Bradyrhizobium sp. Ash2021]|uniref:beta strand repeat-containing protein n=1 Tax=Bradyrhizobium sp. Ash2021 TaxID=2954771 RepID=UPI002816117B|nr:Ig-like domain repeat protein [Bradyrhizobium sp. Ash2021]WMT72491.1 Ig-like domain repeat protein [Bradyrhizobium sp. Ash2021]
MFVFLLLALWLAPHAAWALNCTFTATINENSGANILYFGGSPSGLAADSCLNFGLIATTNGSSPLGSWTSTPSGTDGGTQPGDNQITYTPAAGAAGTDSFSISATDLSPGDSTVAVTITIAAIAPSVSSVSPTSGSTAGGTSLTITGTALTGATGVTVGGAAATNVTVVNDTTVTATAPARSAGTVDVRVTTAGGTSAISGNDRYTYVTPVVAGAVSATVAYDSSSNGITLNLSGGAPSSVAVATAAAHGTATASGTTISYTPATGFFGTDSFTYTATNGTGTSAPATVSITVSAPTIVVSPATLAAGTVGSVYSQSLNASGGQAPYGFALATGSLPGGLSLASSGAITGTPTAAGNFTFTVTGTDSSTATHASFTSGTISLSINATVPGAPTIGTATAGNAQAQVSFTAPASDGGAAITGYTVTSSPGGATAAGSSSPITVTGLSNGTAYTFRVTATNGIGTGSASAASNSVTPVASPPTATQAIASTMLTQNHAATAFTPVTGSGGASPLTYSVSPGLPTGLSMAPATGAITGTPTVTSSATTYTVTVTDANSATATATFSLTVHGVVTATQAIASTTLTINVAATPFTPVTGSGGTGALTYSVSPGLPTGLSMAAATGAITGTPNVSSSATTYTVTVTDANSATATASFSLTVAAPTPVLAVAASGSPASVVPGNDITYSIALTVSTGTATNAALSDPLPAGLTFVSASETGPGGAWTCTTPAVGAAGTVTCSIASAAPGTYNFTIVAHVAAGTPAGPVTNTATATADNAATQSASATNTISLPTLSVAVSGSPATTVAGGNITYSIALIVGTGTATNASLSDPLPAGLTFVSASETGPGGAWTCTTPAVGGAGTVTCSIASAAPGTYNFTIVAQAAAGTPPGPLTNTATASASNAATTSGSATNTVSLTTTSTTLVSSLNPSLVGQSVTFTATVSGSTPAGTVTFKDGATALGTGTLNGSGVATFTTAALTSGSHALTAAYGGDPNNASSTSSVLTQTVGQAATTVAVTSSVNPSVPGQPVTFTATVASAGGTPTGTVIFKDAGAVIGTGALAGSVATLTTAALATGAHSITVSYSGATGFAASASSALTQTVAIPADSIKLRQLQVAVTKVVAQNSGQAIAGAIDTAITDGFSDGGGLVTPSGTGLRFNFSADPDQPGAADHVRAFSDRWNGMFDRGRTAGEGGANSYARTRQNPSAVDDAFAAVNRNTMATKTPPLIGREPKDWLFWADVRGSGVDRWGSTIGTGQSLLYGSQVNALIGLTRKVTPTFLVGIAGGYETFDYTSQDLNGKLKGNGWTVGSYLGWKLTSSIRFDAAVAYSGIGYDDTAGTAQGNFDGRRWLVSSGLTGNYQAYGFDIEPSAKVYALWEHENAYTDSLGTRQDDRNFATGRASGGVKLAYPFAWTDTIALAPYVGLYGDYYFTHDDAATIAAVGAPPLASTPLLDGWSARATAGLAARFASGATLAVGGELGGIGSDTRIWTYRARAAVPF